MNKFEVSKIKGKETVGEILRNARIAKRRRIEQVSDAIGVKKEYLEALEQNRYGDLPQGLYIKTFLREYAVYLGIDQKRLQNLLNESLQIGSKNSDSDVFERTQIAGNRLFIFPRIFRFVVVGLLVLLAVVYFAFYLNNFNKVPFLELMAPTDNIVQTVSFIEILGKTDPEAEVFINNVQALPDMNGNFHFQVNLKKGINLIRVTASKKKGVEAVLERRVLVE